MLPLDFLPQAHLSAAYLECEVRHLPAVEPVHAVMIADWEKEQPFDPAHRCDRSSEASRDLAAREHAEPYHGQPTGRVVPGWRQLANVGIFGGVSEPAKDAPAIEIGRCAGGCAEWLRANGYVTGDCPGACDADVYYAIDARVNDCAVANAVFAIYRFLWTEVLPEIDGRRAVVRNQLPGDEPSEGQLDRLAELYFGTQEDELARSLQTVNASIRRLAADIERVAGRQRERARLKTKEDGARLLRAFHRWVWLGEKVRDLVELPIGLRRGRPIPRTLTEWRRTRTQLEAELHAAEMSDTEIDQVLPGGGGPQEVYRRRYRAKRR